jgi:hypothetical protein
MSDGQPLLPPFVLAQHTSRSMPGRYSAGAQQHSWMKQLRLSATNAIQGQAPAKALSAKRCSFSNQRHSSSAVATGHMPRWNFHD